MITKSRLINMKRDIMDQEKICYEDLELVNLAIKGLSADGLENALEYYATGGKDHPKIREFGCGCCAGRVDSEGDVDYDRSAVGDTARTALAEFKKEIDL